jgi:hypothetical protein
LALLALNWSAIGEEGLPDVKAAIRISNFAEGFSDKRGIACVATLAGCRVGTGSKSIWIGINVKHIRGSERF